MWVKIFKIQQSLKVKDLRHAISFLDSIDEQLIFMVEKKRDPMTRMTPTFQLRHLFWCPTTICALKVLSLSLRWKSWARAMFIK